jgi:hypothetical protein
LSEVPVFSLQNGPCPVHTVRTVSKACCIGTLADTSTYPRLLGKKEFFYADAQHLGGTSHVERVLGKFFYITNALYVLSNYYAFQVVAIETSMQQAAPLRENFFSLGNPMEAIKEFPYMGK